MNQSSIFHPTLLKKIGILALPVMLSNMLQTLITVVDTIMIGQLGPIPIAAVGMANTLRLFILVTLLSVAGGAISLMAQAKGSRDKKQMSFVARQSIVSGLMISVLLGVVGYFLAYPLLDLMNQGGEQEAVTIGTDYLKILFLGTPFLVLNIVTNKLMQGAGDMITPLLITIALVFLNVLFNYLFIFGYGPIPAFGVVGAAFGTILARALLLIVTFWLFLSGKNVIHILKGSWKPHWRMIQDILAIGVPSGIQGVFRNGSNLVIIGIVTATSLGTYGAAVLAIGMQIEQIIAQPIVGMNVAATSLIGQDIGRWQTQEAYQKGIIFTIMGCMAMLILVLPAYIFAEEIIRLFDPSGHPLILEGGLSYFRYTLIALVFSAVAIILTGTLRGAGDTKPAMYSSLFNRNIVQLGVAYLLAFPFGMGYIGAWIGVIMGRVLDSLVMYYIWWKRKWLQVALEKTNIFRIHLQYLSADNRQRYLEEVRTPMMKVSGTLEKVSPEKVVYQQGSLHKIVHFEKGDYRLEVL